MNFIKRSFGSVLIIVMVIPLSGCMDAGLNYMAKRQEDRNKKEAEANPQQPNEENVNAGQEGANKEAITSEIDQLSAQAEGALSGFGESATTNTPTNEGPAISCDSINKEACQSDQKVVCAKVYANYSGLENEEWMEFESACTACKNRLEMEGNKVEVKEYKMGACQQATEQPTTDN